MPIQSVTSDKDNLTVTVVGEYPVPVERLWEAYADPRQLERFWGPETWPATFTRHDMTVGGRSEFHMTGPDGSKSSGYWDYLAVEPGRGFEVKDGFSDEEGRPNEGMPSMRMIYRFDSIDSGSRMTSVTHFPTLDAMEELLKMGVLEGLKSALGQLDGLLAEPRSADAGRAPVA